MFCLETLRTVMCNMLDKLVIFISYFKRTGHSLNKVLVQPVEKLSFNENSTVKFKTIKRFEA